MGYSKEGTTLKLNTKVRSVYNSAYLCSKVGMHHRRRTKFYFKSVRDDISTASWAAQFKYLYSRLAPPRVINFCERKLDSRLGMSIGFLDNSGVFQSNNLHGVTYNDEPARQN